MLKRHAPQLPKQEGEASKSTSTDSPLISGVTSSANSPHAKRGWQTCRPSSCVRCYLAFLMVFIPIVLVMSVVLTLYFPDALDGVTGYFSSTDTFDTHQHKASAIPGDLTPGVFQGGAPVALLVPVLNEMLVSLSGKEMLRALVQPLLESEVALCHRAADGAAVPATVHTVVMTRTAAKVVKSLVEKVMPRGSFAVGNSISNGGKGGALTPGASWRAWELSVSALRTALQLATPSASTATAAAGNASAPVLCFNDTLTLVARATADRSEKYDAEASEALELLVDAGLRTRGGGMGTHFIVLPAFLSGSRMGYAEPGDVTGLRHNGTGLVDALLRTATLRNGGRVAAAQCTIMEQRDPREFHKGGAPKSYPPDELTTADLRSLRTLDKGGFVATTHNEEALMPFMSRRMHGYLATDQRVSWEEVVDAVSLHCGIFSRNLYNAVGGLAAVHADAAMAQAVKEARAASKDVQKYSFVMAPDRGGWALSLRMQEMYPEWQVWGSRGVAVLREHARNVLRSFPAIADMHQPQLSMWDAYGQSVYPTVTRLQRQRLITPWRQRGLIDPSANWSAAEASILPPYISYYTDFTDPCSGLNREAQAYIRPLMERYPIRVHRTTRVCGSPGDAIMAAPYSMLDQKLWKGASPSVKAFFHQRLVERARINFQHKRAPSYDATLKGKRGKIPTVSIGHSLSELSNIRNTWVAPLRERVDEIWATADFFATIYRRNGIPATKIKVVPEAVDVYDYDPANYQREPITTKANDPKSFDTQPHLTVEERMSRYVFFSNFKWEDRKGWDVLFGAYWDAFGPNAAPEMRNRTTLVIKTRMVMAFTRGVTCKSVMNFVEKWGKSGNMPGMRSIHEMPHVIVLCSHMGPTELTQLYASSDAFVFPSKAEGWGLPATEAMSMALPVLITEWSGLRRFITPDTCFRIPLDGLAEIDKKSPYKYAPGMKMAVPSREKTAELMQYVMQHPEHARRVGLRARELIMREMSEEAVGETMGRLFYEAVMRKHSIKATS